MARLLRRILDLSKIGVSGRLFVELSEFKSRVNNYINLIEHTLPDFEEEMLVSVVIPTLNEAGYIKNPLLSLKSGLYQNYEVIVVDCSSEDDTVEKAERFGAKIRLSKRRNRGYQTHLGFLAARGDIVIRTDADTIFPRDTLINTVKAFRDKEVMVHHGSHLYYDGGLLLNIMAYFYDRYWRETWGTPGHFMSVRREAYGKVKFSDQSNNEDFDFGRRAYETLGANSINYSLNTVVLISARKIRKFGLTRHILGKSRTFAEHVDTPKLN